jgi:hypothetical protein
MASRDEARHSPRQTISKTQCHRLNASQITILAMTKRARSWLLHWNIRIMQVYLLLVSKANDSEWRNEVCQYRFYWDPNLPDCLTDRSYVVSFRLFTDHSTKWRRWSIGRESWAERIVQESYSPFGSSIWPKMASVVSFAYCRINLFSREKPQAKQEKLRYIDFFITFQSHIICVGQSGFVPRCDRGRPSDASSRSSQTPAGIWPTSTSLPDFDAPAPMELIVNRHVSSLWRITLKLPPPFIPPPYSFEKLPSAARSISTRMQTTRKKKHRSIPPQWFHRIVLSMQVRKVLLPRNVKSVDQWLLNFPYLDSRFKHKHDSRNCLAMTNSKSNDVRERVGIVCRHLRIFQGGQRFC